jgi:prophage regulatory protein
MATATQSATALDATTAKAHARILRQPDVLARVGLSAPTLWRMRRRGEFPEPVQLSPGTVGYLEDEIDQWLADRKAERARRNVA